MPTSCIIGSRMRHSTPRVCPPPTSYRRLRHKHHPLPGSRARSTLTRHLWRYPRTGGRAASNKHAIHEFVRCLQDMIGFVADKDSSPLSSRTRSTVFSPGTLAEAVLPDYQTKGLIVDVTAPDHHTTEYLRRDLAFGSGYTDGVTVSHAGATKALRTS